MKTKLKTDIPFLTLMLLAALSVPRVVMHDLRLIDFSSPLYKFLAITPLVVWLLVAIFRKTSRPFYDFLILGLLYGLLLALTHQILWDASWNGNLPHLGGNLEGKLDPVLESLLLRLTAFISSVMTGLVAGAGFGLIALLVNNVRKRISK